MSLGEGRVRPGDAAALVELVAGRVDEVGAAVDFDACGREAGQQQIAALVEDPDPVAIGRQMRGGPARTRDYGQILPDPFAASRQRNSP